VTADQLAAVAAIILKRIQDDPKFRGPIGSEGPPGTPGIIDDYDQLAREVLSRLPPVVMQIHDADTGVIATQEKPLGEPIRIRVEGLLEAR
jgi:hypothetical protein